MPCHVNQNSASVCRCMSPLSHKYIGDYSVAFGTTGSCVLSLGPIGSSAGETPFRRSADLLARRARLRL